MLISKQTATRDANAEDIALLERTVGRPLPRDYRIFLSQHNGGKPAANSVEFIGKTGVEDTRIRAFYSLDERDPYYYLIKELEDIRRVIPPFTLPIACDPFDNAFLLDVSELCGGTIYFWDHECIDEDNPDANITRLAASFTEFLDMIQDKIE